MSVSLLSRPSINTLSLLAVGALQGIALSILDYFPSLALLPGLPCWLLAILLPLAFYCSTVASWRRRFIILACVAVVAIAAGCYAAWAFPYKNIASNGIVSSIFFPLFFATFLGVTYFAAPLDEGASYWSASHYSSWLKCLTNSFKKLFVGMLLLGVFWIVAMAMAGVFSVSGLDSFIKWCAKYLYWILTTLVFAAIFAMMEHSPAKTERVTAGVQKFCGWLFPVVGIAAIVCMVSWLLGGDARHETSRYFFLKKNNETSLLLLWFIAILIFFFNVFTDAFGERNGVLWKKSISIFSFLTWLAAIPMAALAVYGMSVRVGAYGWTPDRIWGFFVGIEAIIFVLGYFCASVFRDRRGIVWTNSLASLIAVAGILLMTLGALDPERISVDSQVKRLSNLQLDETQRIASVSYLEKSKSVYGQRALSRLIDEGKNIKKEGAAFGNVKKKNADIALQLQKGSGSWQIQRSFGREKRRLELNGLFVYPGESAPPAGLVDAVVGDRNFELGKSFKPENALFWKAPLGSDGSEAYVFISTDADERYGNGGIWQRLAGKWVKTGHLAMSCDRDIPNLFQAIRGNKVGFKLHMQNDVIFSGGTHMMVIAEEPDGCERGGR